MILTTPVRAQSGRDQKLNRPIAGVSAEMQHDLVCWMMRQIQRNLIDTLYLIKIESEIAS